MTAVAAEYAYGVKPAGHSSLIKKSCDEGPGLMGRCLRFLTWSEMQRTPPTLADVQEYFLKGVTCTMEEANDLIRHPLLHEQPDRTHLKVFFGAVYEYAVPDQVIVAEFDDAAVITGAASRAQPFGGKPVISKGMMGIYQNAPLMVNLGYLHTAGSRCINFGVIDSAYSSHDSLIINAGTIKNATFEPRGEIVNLGDHPYYRRQKRHITYPRMCPGLQHYIETVREIAEQRPLDLIKELGSAEQICADIRRILKGGSR
jgi:hypothetical protein